VLRLKCGALLPPLFISDYDDADLNTRVNFLSFTLINTLRNYLTIDNRNFIVTKYARRIQEMRSTFLPVLKKGRKILNLYRAKLLNTVKSYQSNGLSGISIGIKAGISNKFK
jgi:hypothetical protein